MEQQQLEQVYIYKEASFLAEAVVPDRTGIHV